MEGDEIIKENKWNETVLKNIFPNAVKNLKIPGYNITITRADNISHPLLKVIFKCKSHPSIDATKIAKTGEKLKKCFERR